MMLLREATEQSLKLEAMSLITPSCTSSEELDWGELRVALERLLQDASRTKSSENIEPNYLLV